MNPEAERWIQAHLDGTIQPAEEHQLAAWLKADPAHLKHFTGELLFENELRLAAEAALKPEALTAFDQPAPAPVRRTWARPRFTLLHAAAAVVLFAGLLVFKFTHPSPSKILTVREISGSLAWSNANGEVRPHLAVNDALPAGTFETFGENSHVVLGFDDGTEITLRGECRASIADRASQKQIHLQTGSLRADVTPQPPGNPMLLRTATANVEVVGTVFSLTADADKTTMNVERGRVRMKRTVDGSTVEVSANQTAAVSLETNAPLTATSNGTPPDHWAWDATTPPPPDTRGAWHPAADGQPARLSSLPIVVGTDPQDNHVLVQHGVAFRETGGTTNGSFVTVGDDTKLRFRYHAANVSTIVVFFSSQHPDGGFGGNFEIKLPPGSGEAAGDGWREVTVPLNEMQALHPAVSTHPRGNGILHLSIRSYHETPRLEFSRFSITPH